MYARATYILNYVFVQKQLTFCTKAHFIGIFYCWGEQVIAQNSLSLCVKHSKSEMTLGFVFSILPLLACLFWFIAFVWHYRESDAAKRVLTFFFGVCSVLELCHVLLYNAFEDRILPVPLESLWVACSLSVYPIYYLYICQLTANPVSSRKTVLILVPGILVAFAFLLWPGFTTNIVRLVVNIVQVVFVVFLGFRHLRTFDRKISEFYAETEGKDMRPIRNLLIAFLLTSLNTIVLNILGRESVITSEWLILFALDPIAVLLFVLGYIGYKRSFRAEQFLADDKEGREQNHPNLQAATLGLRLEQLMKDESYYLCPNITLHEVANKVGCCRTYISSYINNELGCTFSDYVNRMRIAHAQELILRYDRSNDESKLSVIALEVGFTNEQSFYRNFRKFTGMTPNAWLKKQRRENHLS